MNFGKCIVIGILSLILIGISFSGGYLWGFGVEHKSLVASLNQIHPILDHTASYKFISPLLSYVIPPATQEADLTVLQNNISTLIKTEKNNGLSDASMFFYDMNRGRWVGVNERQKYNPASMLKVVIMVSYFKEAEGEMGILDKNLVYTDSIDKTLKKRCL